MSIEKRVSPIFKVREDLNRTETARRNIKVLTDLRILFCPAFYRHEGPHGPKAVRVCRASPRCPCILEILLILAILLQTTDSTRERH